MCCIVLRLLKTIVHFLCFSELALYSWYHFLTRILLRIDSILRLPNVFNSKPAFRVVMKGLLFFFLSSEQALCLLHWNARPLEWRTLKDWKSSKHANSALRSADGKVWRYSTPQHSASFNDPQRRRSGERYEEHNSPWCCTDLTSTLLPQYNIEGHLENIETSMLRSSALSRYTNSCKIFRHQNHLWFLFLHSIPHLLQALHCTKLLRIWLFGWFISSASMENWILHIESIQHTGPSPHVSFQTKLNFWWHLRW